MVANWAVSEIDLSDAGFWGRSFGERDAAFGVLRRERPVMFFPEPALPLLPPGPGFWALTRFADVARASREPAIFSSAHGSVLHFSYLRDQDFMDTDGALTEFAVLMVALPWFAAMGGYVNRLRERLAEANLRLEEALQRIGDIAIRAELTGTYNRRFLMESLAREQARAGRARGGYAVCLMDLDHFKAVNDELGHAAGDAALRQVAAVAGRGLRSIDVFGRFGGEEFLLVLPETDMAGACSLAEKVRALVQATRVPMEDGALAGVTLSIGLASLDEAPGRKITARNLIAAADRSLYEAKNGGRNRVYPLVA